MARAEAKATAAALLLLLLSVSAVLSALGRFHGGGGALLGLVVNRRNMILLCHAILLLVLRDAGVLGTPARAAPAAPGAPDDAYGYRARPHASSGDIVVRRRPRSRAAPGAKNAAVDESVPRLINRQQRGPRAAQAARACAPPPALAGPRFSLVEEAAATKALVLVEKPRTILLDQQHRAAVIVGEHEHSAAAVDGNRSTPLDFGSIIAADDEKSRDECETEESVDEMNRRFDKFIADTRRKMQLESLQLPLNVA